MNILVTGANGQLGSEFKDVLKVHTTKDKYFFTDIDELDLTDFEEVRKFITNNDINTVINCAAYTNVDGAEDDYENSALLNIHVVKNLAEIMRDVNGLLIHISTDYVFGSKYNVPIKEKDGKCPLSIYGITKMIGEQAVVDSGCKYLIFRTSWLYSEFGKNFVKTMYNLTSTKSSLKVVFDQVGSPTFAYDLAFAIFNILESEKYENAYGAYHYSNEGVCSWYDLTKMICEYSGHECEIEPCHSSEFPSKVSRPSYSVLDKTKFKKTFGIKIPYWTESLKKCIKCLKNYEYKL